MPHRSSLRSNVLIRGRTMPPDFINASPKFNLLCSLFCPNPMKPLLWCKSVPAAAYRFSGGAAEIIGPRSYSFWKWEHAERPSVFRVSYRPFAGCGPCGRPTMQVRCTLPTKKADDIITQELFFTKSKKSGQWEQCERECGRGGLKDKKQIWRTKKRKKKGRAPTFLQLGQWPNRWMSVT